MFPESCWVVGLVVQRVNLSIIIIISFFSAWKNSKTDKNAIVLLYISHAAGAATGVGWGAKKIALDKILSAQPHSKSYIRACHVGKQ